MPSYCDANPNRSARSSPAVARSRRRSSVRTKPKAACVRSLNFGHTIGHGLEAISSYGEVSPRRGHRHRPVAAAKLSHELTGLSVKDAAHHRSVQARRPAHGSEAEHRQRTKLFGAMKLDKRKSATAKSNSSSPSASAQSGLGPKACRRRRLIKRLLMDAGERRSRNWGAAKFAMNSKLRKQRHAPFPEQRDGFKTG